MTINYNCMYVCMQSHKCNEGAELNQVKWNFIAGGYMRKYRCKTSGRRIDPAIRGDWGFVLYGK